MNNGTYIKVSEIMSAPQASFGDYVIRFGEFRRISGNYARNDVEVGNRATYGGQFHVSEHIDHFKAIQKSTRKKRK